MLYPGDSAADTSTMTINAHDTVPSVDWANPLSWVTTGLRIAKWSPEVIIFPWWMWGWAIPFWVIARIVSMRGTKVLFLCHNVVEHESAGWKKRLTKFTLSTGDSFIVHSQGDMEDLKKIFPSARIAVSFHPTYAVFNTSSMSMRQARSKLGINGKLSKVILFFGIVRPYKGLQYLIEAMPMVVEHVPDVCLVIAGEFWEDKEEYEKRITDLGICEHVRVFDQYVPNEEIEQYFAAADLVVLPYVSATGSGVTQIAFGFNKPVVATAVGDLPQVVEHGRRGFIAQPQDARTLAQAIVNTLHERVLTTIGNNIKQDRELFSWAHLAQTIEQSVMTV
jgi:glycosyltransferase involved in cell wall biosynthesis